VVFLLEKKGFGGKDSAFETATTFRLFYYVYFIINQNNVHLLAVLKILIISADGVYPSFHESVNVRKKRQLVLQNSFLMRLVERLEYFVNNCDAQQTEHVLTRVIHISTEVKTFRLAKKVT